MAPFYHESVPNASGIYLITCTITSKIYVGSAINLRQRRKGHFTDLQRNVHCNPKLQRAWNKYGEESFTFEILELVLLPELLTAREQHWFKKLKPFGNKGFNIAREAGSALGHRHTPETREKQRVVKLGKPNPNRGNQKGRKASPETRIRLSAARIGNTNTLGHTLSPEHRAKISTSLIGNTRALGYKHSPETREKISKAHLGRTLSEASRAKLSIANKGQRRDPKAFESKRKTLIVTAPDGTEHFVHGVSEFCKEHHLNRAHLMQVARGKFSQHKGWKARFPDVS